MASQSGGNDSGTFDLDRIREIIELMEQHGLGEIDLQSGDDKIRLTRGSVTPVMPAMMPAAVSAMPQTPGGASGGSGSSGGDTAGTITINAPMIGTFYGRPKPDAEPFVKVGDRVTKDQTVCIIEAMKVFNEIPAEVEGEVVEILAADGSAVDFDKPLIRVRN